MRAITVIPGKADSARLDDVPEPSEEQGDVLVDGLALGICGTDAEIVRGEYGYDPPPGEERMVLGHESLGRVRETPDGSGLSAGDLVVGIVRRPDPEPCYCCARGEFDFCRNGRYTERGIKERHGYGSERWRVEADYAVRLDPALEAVGVLMEPTSVLAKAWEQIERISARACHEPQSVLVTGAGPIGLLAAMLGVQRGLEVRVLDTVKEGVKPQLVKDLGATYHSDGVKAVGVSDIVIEATGVGQVVVDALHCNAAGGIVCLTGVSPAGRSIDVDIGMLNRTMVLENDVVFGSVNANRRHYEAAAEALANADQEWLGRLITRHVPLSRWEESLEKDGHDDVKVVVDLAQ
jgi:threonine dehydrogenase-like Zn-dependent dehydrogenase